jgi:NAD(P)-dependent dehydrogenase (short-subunit alcohol dehydrogenase family)
LVRQLRCASLKKALTSDRLSLSSEGAQETQAKVEASGRKGFIVKADLGVVSDIRQMIASAIQNFGKLNILVNNAGIEKNADFWSVTEADYDSVINVNLKGIFCYSSHGAALNRNQATWKNHQHQLGTRGTAISALYLPCQQGRCEDDDA